MTETTEYKVEVKEIDMPSIGKSKLINEIWRHAEKGMHRAHGPAVVTYDPKDGAVYRASYYVENEGHRVDGPSEMHISADRIQEYWHANGQQHRYDGPAVIERLRDGTIILEAWFTKDKRHREGGPALIEYDRDPPHQISYLAYYREGKLIKALKPVSKKPPAGKPPTRKPPTSKKKNRPRKPTLG